MISGVKWSGDALKVDSQGRLSVKDLSDDVLLRKRDPAPAPAPAPASSFASSPSPGLGRYAAPGKHVVSAPALSAFSRRPHTQSARHPAPHANALPSSHPHPRIARPQARCAKPQAITRCSLRPPSQRLHPQTPHPMPAASHASPFPFFPFSSTTAMCMPAPTFATWMDRLSSKMDVRPLALMSGLKSLQATPAML